MIEVMQGQTAIPRQVAPPEEDALLFALADSDLEPIPLPRAIEHPDRLRQLVIDHLDFVWRNLRRLGNSSADADELVQEAFLVASRKLDEIRPGSERSYLLSIAMNIASTRRRSYSREALRIDRSQVTCSPEPLPTPEQAVEESEARRELDTILNSMTLDLRTVFVLYELEELTTKEIANLLNIKEGTVASRLRRARDAFREAIAARNHTVVSLHGESR
jgi:RNA polymerase sigma-70 factor (ECF subfamily)